jgi:hypothetical protein
MLLPDLLKQINKVKLNGQKGRMRPYDRILQGDQGSG